MSLYLARRPFLRRSMTGVGGIALLDLLNHNLDGAMASWPAEEQQVSGEKVHTARIVSGDVAVGFRDNSYSPRILSGVESLVHVKSALDFNAFDPDTIGAAAGLNFEHIISGHADPANSFTPRHGRYSLFKLPDERSVTLVRSQEDCPWAISSTLKYTVTAPHYIDLEFRCVAHEEKLFGKRGYAILFFANYMNNVAELPIHFRGVSGPGVTEEWIAGDAPNAHPDWNRGGTYRHASADAISYDENHNFKLNVWSYDYPRFSKPFWYGLTARGMVFQMMFDRDCTARDQVRFSVFKFKLPKLQRPAWDFQYVIHKVEEGKEYGFRTRVVWKSFVSPDDCLAEYEKWQRLMTAKAESVTKREIGIN
jgi:hypothetical protein